MTIRGQAAHQARIPQGTRSWLWGAGVALVVALIIGGAYAGHHVVVARQLASRQVAAPTVPPASVVRVIRPEAGAAFVAPLGDGGKLFMLAGRDEPSCPPTSACAPAPRLDTAQVVDGTSGETLAQSRLDGTAGQPVAVAVDDMRQVVDIVTASAIEVRSAATTGTTTTFALPAGVTASSATGAIITRDGLLVLTARQDGQLTLVGLDESSGAVRFRVAMPEAQGLDGPIYDGAHDLILTLTHTPDRTTLAAFTAQTGAPRGSLDIPAGTRLGPVDAATGRVYLFGLDGTVSSLSPDMLVTGTEGQGLARPEPMLRGARALGWNQALGHVYVADASTVRIVNASTGSTLAALPLEVASTPTTPLSVSEHAGLLFLPAGDGSLVVVRDVASGQASAMTADTAALLARAAVVRLVPQGAQDPLFVSPESFPAGRGSRTPALWIDDPDAGWISASPTRTQTDATATTGVSGAFDVTLRLSWMQHDFMHEHTWVCRVTAGGAVRVVSDHGDALP